ncbi:uncharacterized protein LOC130895635 isoform X1 [Diorhabda carinulata]|uniref:uncharacterized protein LOC130895635 isoform X1 n=1 Tax=Diorhabda carinulata TaxID=1163345 RepID=UPI0025A06E77|nr:uncharacterized protein LOC130895635 isoform X1 [Diorhabda carinulata]
MKLTYIFVIIFQINFVRSLNETNGGNGKKYFFKMKQNSSDFIITSRIPHLGPKELEYPVIQKKLNNATAINEESVENITEVIDDSKITTKKTIITSRIPHLGPKQLEYPVIQKKTTYQTTDSEEQHDLTEDNDDKFNETDKKSVLKALDLKIIQEKIIFDENVTDFVVYKIEPKVIQEFMEKVTKFAGKCMEETKATNEDIAMLMAHQTPSTHEGICMISCMYKAFGVQNADGTMNPDEGINMLGKIKDTDPDLFEKMEAVVNKCRDTPVEEDPCITALNVAKCLMKEGKEMGLSQDMLGM